MGANASSTFGDCEPPLRWLPQGVTRSKFRDLESKAAMQAMWNGGEADPEYTRVANYLFGNLVESGERFSLVLDCMYGMVAVWIRVQEPGKPEDQFCADNVARAKVKSTRQLHKRLMEKLRNLGLSMDILRKRMVAVHYEHENIFDEVAYLMRKTVSPEIKMVPFLSHHSAKAAMAVLRRNAGLLGIRDMLKILEKGATPSGLANTLKRKLEELQSGELDEDWLIETHEAGSQLVEYIATRPSNLKSIALMLVEFVEILIPLVDMKNALRAAFETSSDQAAWLNVKPQLVKITEGIRFYRATNKQCMRLDEPGIPVAHINKVVSELIELFDTRFAVCQRETRDA